MTVPVIASLAAQYPKLRISVVSRPTARPLFQHLAPNVDFMAADVGSEYHGVRGLNTLYRRMVAKHPTAVADLHDVLRTKFLRHRFTLEGFKVAHIDKHRKGKRRLCAQKNKELVQQPTSFDNYAEVFAKLGYPVSFSFTSIFPKEGADLTPSSPSSAKRELRKCGSASPPLLPMRARSILRRRCEISSPCSTSVIPRGVSSFWWWRT